MNMSKASPSRVIFLDRDGTINVDTGYVNTIENWQWQPGVPAGLKQLQDNGFTLVVVTNQTGVGHRLYTVDDVQRLHSFMEAELAKHGVHLAAIAFCPHRQDAGCDCRKPRTGMARQIEAKVGPINYAASWMVGDKTKDVGFGQGVGVKTALIKSRYWTEADLSEQPPDMIVDSLADFAQKITHINGV